MNFVSTIINFSHKIIIKSKLRIYKPNQIFDEYIDFKKKICPINRKMLNNNPGLDSVQEKMVRLTESTV